MGGIYFGREEGRRGGYQSCHSDDGNLYFSRRLAIFLRFGLFLTNDICSLLIKTGEIFLPPVTSMWRERHLKWTGQVQFSDAHSKLEIFLKFIRPVEGNSVICTTFRR
jgi:hypothetical protein